VFISLQELVEDLDDSIDPNTVFPWFHPTVTKQEAVDMLVQAGPGSFLVRPSDNSPGDYSLFFHINSQIQRFRIEKKGVRYLMGGRTFECLDAVINRLVFFSNSPTFRRSINPQTMDTNVCQKVQT
jgi:Ras GTPase-activating protein 1